MASPLMKECQYTDHGNSKTHSNPQDNIIGFYHCQRHFQFIVKFIQTKYGIIRLELCT